MPLTFNFPRKQTYPGVHIQLFRKVETNVAAVVGKICQLKARVFSGFPLLHVVERGFTGYPDIETFGLKGINLARNLFCHFQKLNQIAVLNRNIQIWVSFD